MLSSRGVLHSRRGTTPGARLAWVLVFAASAAHAAPGLDGCDATPDPLHEALWRAEQSLQAGEAQAVRDQVARVQHDGARSPYYLLRAGRLLEGLGDQSAADASYAQALAAAKHPGPEDDAHTAKLSAAAALVQLGRAPEASPLVAAVRASPGALKKYACRYIPLAMAMADRGDAVGATALLEAVRTEAPDARSVHDALVELAFRSGDGARIDAALEAALARFPKDVAFTVRRANQIKVRGKADEARAMLEQLILTGEEDPNLLGEYLGLVSGEARARQSLEQTLRLAEANPSLRALSMLVGVEYHYLGDYENSTKWLSKTGELIDREPRIPMYLAMNEFRLRHQAEAEALIERAARAGRPDPDIYYCRAIISVRKDPAASVRDLEHYMHLTSGRPDANPGKQERVQQTLDLVRRCTEGTDPLGCVQRDVVDKALALAFNEHLVALRPAVAAEPEMKPAPPVDGHGGPGPALAAIGAALVLLLAGGLAVRRRAQRRS